MREIPEIYKNIVNNPSIMYDIHCHIFNHECVPNGFLKVRLPFTDRFLTFLENVTGIFGKLFDNDDISNTSYFLNMFKQDMPYIYRKLLSYFPDNAVFCPLTMDMHGIRGKQTFSFQQQIKFTLELQNEYPSKLIPFLCLNPRNPRMDEYFHRYINFYSLNNGFWGVKIYPAMGYLPSDPRLMSIFSICDTFGIPITTHCSKAIVKTTDHRLKNIKGMKLDAGGNVDEFCIKSKWFWREKDYSKFFNHPKNWEVVLNKFPTLKLNFAHFGGFEQGDNTWYVRILDMMKRYPNVYADVSYILGDYDKLESLRSLITSCDVAWTRTLYGTDYYMIVLKDHFRMIKNMFETQMGDLIMHQISQQNPRRFLFE